MVSGGIGRESITTIRLSSPEIHGAVLPSNVAAERVLDVIENGGLVVVPFDVSYAFLAGALEPLQRIYELKLRPGSKACPILASWEHFERMARSTADESARIKRVVDAGLPVGVLATPDWTSPVAQPIPEDCRPLLERDGRVALFLNMGGMSGDILAAADRRDLRIFGSSANISGTGNSFALEEVPTSILDSTDLICDAGRSKYANPERVSSTIVDLGTGEIVRAGILYEEIKERLKG